MSLFKCDVWNPSIYDFLEVKVFDVWDGKFWLGGFQMPSSETILLSRRKWLKFSRREFNELLCKEPRQLVPIKWMEERTMETGWQEGGEG